jgi:hypothetical protein
MKKGQFHSGYKRGLAPVKQMTCIEVGWGFVNVKCIFLFSRSPSLLFFTIHEDDTLHSDQLLLS